MHQFLAMRQLDHIILYMQANVTTGHSILIKVTPLWEPSFLPLAAGHLISIYILFLYIPCGFWLAGIPVLLAEVQP